MNTPVTADTPIAARFRDVVSSCSETLALVSLRGRYSYAELDRWSDAIAHDVINAAAPLDVPVAIVVRDHVSLVPAALAVVKAGHFFFVIDAGDSEERIAAMLDATGATLCLADAPLPALASHRTLLRMRTAAQPAHARIERTPHELVQLVFTSGTTGKPKAVASPQRGFVERHVRGGARRGRAAGERVSYTAMPGHARATGEIFGTLLNGATLCAFDARTEALSSLAEMIERERISILTLTPALFRRFMRLLPATTDLSSVRKLRLGADVITTADVDAWRARFPRTTTLERAFNSTETGLVLHMTFDHDTPVPGPLVPLGRPVDGVDVRIVDEEGRDVPDGETGELVVRSAHVAQGYWNEPKLTAQQFASDPRAPETRTFRTGDLVRRGADGLYYFIGRRDARLKIHGRRIDPVEVETALLVHAGAREAVVLAAPDQHGEQRLAAFVVMHESTAGAREIRAALRGHLSAWMIPSRVHLLDALPMTRTGKVDRAALAERAAAQMLGGTDDVETDDELERTLLAIWSRVIGMTVALDDDFFDALGGESLMAAEIVSEVSRATGTSLPLSLLVELNTVRRMAGYLRARPAAGRTLIALQRGGSHPPLFCVSGKGGSVIVFRALAALLGEEQPFYGLTHHGFDPEAFPTTHAAAAACYLDAVRATQPAGPYYLAGYSAGGFIAYEMAQQLARAGEMVAFLGLLDTAARSGPATRTRRLRKQLIIFRRRPLAAAGRYARAAGRRCLWLARWIRNRGTKPFVPVAPPEVVAVNRFFQALATDRNLQPYSGPVTVFLARQGRGADCVVPDAGWSAYCGSNLEVIDIDGEHDSIINEDVELLARPLARALAAARAQVDAGQHSSAATG
ncbi:MAG TPA: non-ribosomal peptide synthetase [Thermoanaerobaculia bacterium]|jgi:amino acid adenylation domain-containing protein